MDPNKIRRLDRATGSCHDHVVWFMLWLEHLNMFSEAQVYDIIKFVGTEALVAREAPRLPSHAVCVFNVVVCDSRWVTFSGGVSFWDTATAEEIKTLPQPAITHVTCDFTALLQRRKNGSKSNVDATSDTNQASQ